MSTTPNSMTATSPTPALGAPRDNTNHLRTGLRSDRLNTFHRVGNSSLPREFERVDRHARTYRRRLEEAVEAARGEINLTDSHHISSAVRAERACHAIHKLLRDDAKLSTSDKAAMLQRTVTLTEKRDAAVAKLNLPGPESEADLWTTILRGSARPRLPEQVLPDTDQVQHDQVLPEQVLPPQPASQQEPPEAE